jgi:hypothetical protein
VLYAKEDVVVVAVDLVKNNSIFRWFLSFYIILNIPCPFISIYNLNVKYVRNVVRFKVYIVLAVFW